MKAPTFAIGDRVAMSRAWLKSMRAAGCYSGGAELYQIGRAKGVILSFDGGDFVTIKWDSRCWWDTEADVPTDTRPQVIRNIVHAPINKAVQDLE